MGRSGIEQVFRADTAPDTGKKITRVGKQYAAAGIVSLIVAVTFIFTMDSPGVWISIMVLGIVFNTSGATGAFEKNK